MQIESVIAALLCALCCILLMISSQSTSKRFLHVAIILPCAVLFESVLIGRASTANATIAKIISGDVKQELKPPHSIILAGVGVLFAAIGCLFSIGMHCKVRTQESQNTQDLELTEPVIVLQDPYTCITNSGSQARDMTEAPYTSLTV